jgi:hypothetical protein
METLKYGGNWLKALSLLASRQTRNKQMINFTYVFFFGWSAMGTTMVPD